ncbi:hypothetical protein GGQ08_003207 [Salinibacter ruber]|uniref:hypothetical protein n=1 Tax=Salinibacter ruber TaxID=146919 RepID=UPI00216934AB|nr:hypothetical protein [Salinibacter ruber]MCS3651895.1 hypothetical protein [Salinibacter ruber]MCS3655116.1 hypothetical protein [Salinibacter ruber]
MESLFSWARELGGIDVYIEFFSAKAMAHGFQITMALRDHVHHGLSGFGKGNIRVVLRARCVGTEHLSAKVSYKGE